MLHSILAAPTLQVEDSLSLSEMAEWQVFLTAAAHQNPRRAPRFARAEQVDGRGVLPVLGRKPAGRLATVGLVSLLRLPELARMGRMKITPFWLGEEAATLAQTLPTAGWLSSEVQLFRRTGWGNLVSEPDEALAWLSKSARREQRRAERQGIALQPVTDESGAYKFLGSLNQLRRDRGGKLLRKRLGPVLINRTSFEQTGGRKRKAEGRPAPQGSAHLSEAELSAPLNQRKNIQLIRGAGQRGLEPFVYQALLCLADSGLPQRYLVFWIDEDKSRTMSFTVPPGLSFREMKSWDDLPNAALVRPTDPQGQIGWGRRRWFNRCWRLWIGERDYQVVALDWWRSPAQAQDLFRPLLVDSELLWNLTLMPEHQGQILLWLPPNRHTCDRGRHHLHNELPMLQDTLASQNLGHKLRLHLHLHRHDRQDPRTAMGPTSVAGHDDVTA